MPIFNSALTDEELKTFWRQYQELKNNCLKDIPPEIAKEDDLVYYWESNFQAERLEFIKNYIDSSLQLLRNMRCLVKGGAASITPGSNHRGANVVSKYKKWRCILCRGNHSKENQNIRPYMSSCKSFIDMSVETRKQFIKKMATVMCA